MFRYRTSILSTSKPNSKLDLQVSNPNLDKVNIYPFTPFVGFRGILNIIEKIMNIKL